MNRQGCSCGFSHERNTVSPAITIATATRSDNPMVFRREASSRSNPRVTWTIKGTSQKPFLGGGVSMQLDSDQKQSRIFKEPTQFLEVLSTKGAIDHPVITTHPNVH